MSRPIKALRRAAAAAMMLAAGLALAQGQPASATGAAALAAAPAASWVRKSVHENWEVICMHAAGTRCQAVQQLDSRHGNDSSRVLRLVAQKAQEGLILSFELPLGVDLRSGMVYQLDAASEVGLPYLTCTAQGCLASVLLRDEGQRQMVAGKHLVIGFRSLGSDQILAVEVRMDGIDRAVAAL